MARPTTCTPKKANHAAANDLLYFFKKEVKNDEGFNALDDLPAGYTATESPQTGLPLLKKAG